MNPISVKPILIIEDNREREQALQSWLPPDFRPVVASGAGKAIGILRRDRGAIYAGVVLDHDLQERCATETDGVLSGLDVVHAMIQHLSRDIPVLVHSNNATQAPILVSGLRRAGFDVTRIPMYALTKELLEEWLREVSDNWESITEQAD